MEKKEIEELSHKNQREYLVDGKMSRKDFQARSTQNEQRMAEIEREESLVLKKVEKVKKSFRYGVVSRVRILGGILRSVVFKKNRSNANRSITHRRKEINRLLDRSIQKKFIRMVKKRVTRTVKRIIRSVKRKKRI